MFTLDTEDLTQFVDPAKPDEPWRVALPGGQGAELPNGAGSIAFDGYAEWGAFQVAHDPGKGLALASAAAAIAGVMLSLGIRRRRVWVRVSPAGGVRWSRLVASPVLKGGASPTSSPSCAATWASRRTMSRRVAARGGCVVDEGLAQLSNNLTYSAIAVYVLALVLYAAELAFGARGVVARTAHAAAQPVVGAGRRWQPSTMAPAHEPAVDGTPIGWAAVPSP